MFKKIQNDREKGRRWVDHGQSTRKTGVVFLSEEMLLGEIEPGRAGQGRPWAMVFYLFSSLHARVRGATP